MDYLLLALIVFLASFAGASLGSLKRGESVVETATAPVTKVIKKIGESIDRKKTLEAAKKEEIAINNWLYGKEDDQNV